FGEKDVKKIVTLILVEPFDKKSNSNDCDLIFQHEHHRAVYIKPQYRIGSHTVGILLGYYLANNGKLSQTKLFYGWFFSIVLAVVSLFGLYPSLQGWDCWSYHLIYGGLHRTAWAIAISWLIFACHNGHAYYLNRFLSHPFFIYLSKGTYAVSFQFLFHSSQMLTDTSLTLKTIQIAQAYSDQYCTAGNLFFTNREIKKQHT
uniref:AcidPPc domain-containing protein n=1 Tax=Elaeophora elaphi TaxID=1147741 RepID=A0A0R3S153_9BILA